MKKNPIYALTFAVVATALFLKANSGTLKDMSDIALANVEALAQSESWDWYCVGDLDICLKDEIGIIFGKKFYE